MPIKRLLRSLGTSLAWCAALVAAAPARAQTATRLHGTLNIMWGDPHPGHAGGATRYTLTLPDGRIQNLVIPTDQAGTAATLFGRDIIAGGTLAGPTLAVQTLQPTAQTLSPRAVTGTRRVLFVLLKFQGQSQTPHPPAFYLDLTNPLKPKTGSTIPATLNGFFSRTSWGKLQWQADVAGVNAAGVGSLKPTTWFTLPYPKTHYANCGWSGACADLTGIRTDALALVTAAGINLTVYNNVNFVLNDDLDCCAWGGGFSYAGKSYGATWEPPWGQEAGTYAHEFGHSIGLPHSGWMYYAYDSPWDVMSDISAATSANCGSYASTNNGGATDTLYCSEPGDGYIAAHKDYLGWIPAANEVVVNTIGTQTVILESAALPLASNPKLIKICITGAACTGSAAHYITVETRIKGTTSTTRYDNALTANGVLIEDFKANRSAIGAGNPCFFNSQSGWAVPIDATPNDWKPAPACSPGSKTWPHYALGNAEFLPTKSWVSAADGITVQIGAKTGLTYAVTVTRTK